jgi:hypothetical protein
LDGIPTSQWWWIYPTNITRDTLSYDLWCEDGGFLPKGMIHSCWWQHDWDPCNQHLCKCHILRVSMHSIDSGSTQWSWS